MKQFTSLITLFLFVLVTHSSGADYYIDSVDGSDGKTWSSPVAKGNVQASATEQHFIKFTNPTDALFVKLTVTNAVSAGGQSIAAIGELDVVLSNKP